MTIAVKNIVKREFLNPGDEFTRYFVRETNDGKYSAKLIETYTPIVKRCIQSYINDIISERLNTAIESGKEKTNHAPDEPETSEIPEGAVYVSEDRKIITMQEEVDAYHIVKNILRQKVDVSRIEYRDYQSYFVISIDGVNKWICRLYFKKYKYISFPLESSKEEKIEIESLDDIYKYSDKLISSLENRLEK